MAPQQVQSGPTPSRQGTEQVVYADPRADPRYGGPNNYYAQQMEANQEEQLAQQKDQEENSNAQQQQFNVAQMQRYSQTGAPRVFHYN